MKFLSHVLGTDDPFALDAADVVDRVLAAGYKVMTTHPFYDAAPGKGIVARVDRDGRMYFVGIDSHGETITVQEGRVVAYGPVV